MTIDFGIIHHMPTDGNKVYIKQMRLAAGHFVDTHKHEYDHYGILGAGVAIVDLDGVESRHIGPCVIEIKADRAHKITAVEDIIWFCVHGTDETDPVSIDQTLIKGG